MTVALCLTPSCAQGPSEYQRLVLNELSSLPLPASLGFDGLSRSEDDVIVVWGREPNVVFRFNKTLVSDGEWTLPDTVPPLAAWSGVDRIEVVTSNPPAIHFFGDGGTPSGSQPIAAEGIVLEAARGREGWYILLETIATGELTVRFPGGRESRAAPSYGGLTLDDRERVERVWLTELRYPFGVYDLTDGDKTKAAMQPDPQTLDGLLSMSGAEGSSNWASLPVVVLEGGFLQTLADLSSDRRVFIVYGPGGEVLSANPLDVPLGLLVSANNLPRIYGARRTNILEIVEYSYRWDHESFGVEGM